MILFSLLTMVIVSIVFFLKKSISLAMFTFMGLILFYIVVVYGVMPEVLLYNIDIKLVIEIFTLFSFIAICKSVMDKYLVNEVGLDLADLFISIFPDRRLKLFVVFFIGQLAFSQFLLINILIIYFIGKILRVDSILIMIVGMVSLIVNNLFDMSYMLSIQDYISSSDYLLVNNISYLFLMLIMGLVFITIFMSMLFIKGDNDDDFIDILKKDWAPWVIIIISYLVLFFSSTLFFDLNYSQFVVSLIMLGIISFSSTKLMRHNHEFMENENKKYPFIFSIMIFIVNGVIIYLANDHLIIAVLIFSVFNYMVLKKYETYESDNILDINMSSKFILKLAGIAIFIYSLSILISYSNINTSSINNSMFDQLSVIFQTLNSALEVLIFFICIAPMCIFMPMNELVNYTSSTSFIVLIMYFSAIFTSFNIIVFYIMHDLLGVDDSQALVGYHAIMAFSIIVGTILTIIVLIGG